MFGRTAAFNQDISSWDVSQATNTNVSRRRPARESQPLARAARAAAYSAVILCGICSRPLTHSPDPRGGGARRSCACIAISAACAAVRSGTLRHPACVWRCAGHVRWRGGLQPGHRQLGRLQSHEHEGESPPFRERIKRLAHALSLAPTVQTAPTRRRAARRSYACILPSHTAARAAVWRGADASCVCAVHV